MTVNVTRYWASTTVERKVRRHEQQVEQRHAGERRRHRRTATEPNRADENDQQEQHDDIGQVQPAAQRQGGERGQRAKREGDRIARGEPVAWHEAAT
jgi:hypothetical protein